MTMRLLIALVLLTAAAHAGPVQKRDMEAVEVRSTPPGAQVYRADTYEPDGARGYLGTTPLILMVDAERSHMLRLQKDGYSPQRIRLEPGQSGITVSLTPSHPMSWISHQVTYEPQRSRPVLLGLLALVLAGALLLRARRLGPPAPPETEGTLSGHWLLNRVVGDYRLLEVVGEGTSSWVFKAEHVSYGDIYALKMMKSVTLDEEARAHFGREMEAGRDLKAPGLVRVYAVGDFQGAPYLVMDYVRGVPLMQLRSRSTAEFIELMIKVCDALAVAHRHGIVHRDLKPDNILVQDDGQPRLMDFGMVRFLDRRRVTATGAILGTPHYMAPEQSRGDVDARSDIYSLGCIMYQWMTGKVPFDSADPVAVLAAHRSQVIPPPRQQDGSPLPAGMDDVIVSMLHKDPGMRPQRVSQISQMLKEVLERLALPR